MKKNVPHLEKTTPKIQTYHLKPSSIRKINKKQELENFLRMFNRGGTEHLKLFLTRKSTVKMSICGVLAASSQKLYKTFRKRANRLTKIAISYSKVDPAFQCPQAQLTKRIQIQERKKIKEKY